MNTQSHILKIIQGVIGKYCETQERYMSITLINELQCSYVCLHAPYEHVLAQCEKFIIPALKSVNDNFVLKVRANTLGVNVCYWIDDANQENTFDVHGLLVTKQPIDLALKLNQNVGVLTDCETLFKSCSIMSAHTHELYAFNFRLYEDTCNEFLQLEDLRHLNSHSLMRKLDTNFLKNSIKLYAIGKVDELNKDIELSGNVLGWPFFDTDLVAIRTSLFAQKRLSVLVADDSLPSQVATKVMLEMLGCSVTCADNGASALTLALNNQFDLLLLDECMPEIFGSDVAQQLVSKSTLNTDTPKAILSGLTDDVQIAKLFKKGITHYLQKPVTKADLEKFIKPWQLN
ncbi:response regulator [Pseudoalteromonas fuliginea]|uniref:Response regulator n=2 Tax=Pseudoalteromonas fuliginea TaxID=1872678 RepID=A0AB73BBL9_9GAMM|nr:response regulator [Pseudoalteromonas fuliginea]